MTVQDEQSRLYDCRDVWAETIADVARKNDQVVVVVNDSVGSSKLNAFQGEFPDRTVNVGIAEQNMVGVAAGLANGGKIPFVSAAGCFLTARAMEQIKADVAYSKHNVKLIGQSPGIAYGDLGPTHHSIEDLTWMRTIPGMSVVVPADPNETRAVIRWASEQVGPVYIRIARTGVPSVYSDDYEFSLGASVELRSGDDVTIIATGTVVSLAIAAADTLRAEGINARVLSMPCIKPIDRAAILAAASQTSGIVTVEEGLVTGLGGSVAEIVAAEVPCRVKSIGFNDAFAETGSVAWLFEQNGITIENIAEQAKSLVK